MNYLRDWKNWVPWIIFTLVCVVVIYLIVASVLNERAIRSSVENYEGVKVRIVKHRIVNGSSWDQIGNLMDLDPDLARSIFDLTDYVINGYGKSVTIKQYIMAKYSEQIVEGL